LPENWHSHHPAAKKRVARFAIWLTDRQRDRRDFYAAVTSKIFAAVVVGTVTGVVGFNPCGFNPAMFLPMQ